MAIWLQNKHSVAQEIEVDESSEDVHSEVSAFSNGHSSMRVNVLQEAWLTICLGVQRVSIVKF